MDMTMDLSQGYNPFMTVFLIRKEEGWQDSVSNRKTRNSTILPVLLLNLLRFHP